MTSTTRFFLSLCLLALLWVGCAPKPDPAIQINQAVAATVGAIPTYTPYPSPSAYPSPTKATLAGLFCEYQFCIGHPPDIAFFDVSAQIDPLAPSSYIQGFLAAYSIKLLIQIIWQHSPDTVDPKFLMDLILKDEVDERVGEMDIMLIRDMNVMYTSITTTATQVLPFGGTAAWTCGDRVFAWKSYTPQEGQGRVLFEEAIQRFRCDN